MTMNNDDVHPDMPTGETLQSMTTAAEVKGIQLPVKLELETITLTVEELAGIHPGYIFETTKPVESPVTMKVNGKAIGIGELVDVAGKVGVRVLSLGKKGKGESA